ncbi:MAG: hypothetical protein CR974_03995 [Gammaproteobacteria bacterium]|nr:MAG: hypothetical protein CR974_03995 [Gammaproteobacteria bacterium]
MTMTLNPDQQNLIKRLQRHVQRTGHNYSLYFAECNLPTLRPALLEAFSAGEANVLTVSIKDYPSEGKLHIDNWIGECIRESETPVDAVSIIDLEVLLPIFSEKTIIATVSEINWRRSSYQALGLPLVFWLPSYALQLLAKHASDFYDWYTDVFVFEGDERQLKVAQIEQRKTLVHPKTKIPAKQYQDKDKKQQELRRLKALLSETQRLADRAYLEYEIGQLLYSLGEYSEALVHYERSKAINKNIGNKQAISAILNNVALIYDQQGYYDEALENYQLSLEIKNEIDDKEGIATTLNNMALIYHAQGNYDSALKNYQRSLKIDESIDNKSGVAVSLNNISHIYNAQKDYENALDYLERSLKILEKNNDKTGLAATLNNIAGIHYRQGDYPRAFEVLKRSLQIRENLGDKAGIANTSVNLGVLLSQMPNHPEHPLAEQYFQHAKELAQEMVLHQVLEDLKAMER